MATRSKKASKKKTVALTSADGPLRLDLGCGTRKVGPEWYGVDKLEFPGVDRVVDLTARNPDGTFKKWPWKDDSVIEVNCTHFLEHLEVDERIHFVNELWRILKPEGQAKVVVPHWASCRAYGDLTHKWPPVSEFWFFYLARDWRASEAPHNTEYTCNFHATWGYGMNAALNPYNEERKQYMLQWYKEAAQELHATLIKKP